MTDDELRAKLAARLAEMPEGITAAKRIHVVKSDVLENWWVGFGKDESCQIEGTQNHWRWLALIILGLVDAKDAPYTKDIELDPDPLLALLDRLADAEVRATAAEVFERELQEQRDALEERLLRAQRADQLVRTASVYKTRGVPADGLSVEFLEALSMLHAVLAGCEAVKVPERHGTGHTNCTHPGCIERRAALKEGQG